MFCPEHIFINRRIKLPLERYKKKKKGKHTKPKKKRHLWIFSRVSVQRQIQVRAKTLCLQYRKKKKKRKGRSETETQTAIFTLRSPPVHVPCSHSRWHETRKTSVHDQKWNYIYKKNTIEQCGNSDQLKINKKKSSSSSYYYYFYHTESAISHQRREPVIKMIEARCTDGSPKSRYDY